MLTARSFSTTGQSLGIKRFHRDNTSTVSNFDKINFQSLFAAKIKISILLQKNKLLFVISLSSCSVFTRRGFVIIKFFWCTRSLQSGSPTSTSCCGSPQFSRMAFEKSQRITSFIQLLVCMREERQITIATQFPIFQFCS